MIPWFQGVLDGLDALMLILFMSIQQAAHPGPIKPDMPTTPHQLVIERNR